MSRARLARRAAGFSLIELMIAVAVGLVLTIVVAQLFLGSRRTYATTDDVSRMQEGIRYAVATVTRSVHHAGYRSSPNVAVDAVFNAATPPVLGVEGGGTAADSFTVRYEGHNNGPGAPDNTVVDCLGQPVAAGVMSVNTFSIGPVGTRNSLLCNGEEIVPGVRNMQVLYGVNTTPDGFGAETYVTAAGVTDWLRVRSMRIAMLFETENPNVTPVPDAQVYQLNGPAPLGAALGPFNDTRIRRDLTYTITLRNRTP